MAHASADRSRRSLRCGQGYGVDDLGAARQPAGPACDLPARAEHEYGRCPPDIELPGQVRARGHVDLDVHYAIAAAGQIGKQLPRSAARSAEGRGELQQSSPGAKRLAQVSLGQPPHR
jgi:hypothetical protein